MTNTEHFWNIVEIFATIGLITLVVGLIVWYGIEYGNTIFILIKRPVSALNRKVRRFIRWNRTKPLENVNTPYWNNPQDNENLGI